MQSPEDKHLWIRLLIYEGPKHWIAACKQRSHVHAPKREFGPLNKPFIIHDVEFDSLEEFARALFDVAKHGQQGHEK